MESSQGLYDAYMCHWLLKG